MARILANGLIQFNDGRILYSDTPLTGQDFIELVPLLSKIDPILGRSAMAGFPFISGGGGGPGPQGPQGPQGPPGPPGPSIDLFAATRIVSNDPTQGTDTTIQGAIDNLPAEGGLIYIKTGTYPQSSTITLPDKPVIIAGSGDGTIITLPAFAGPLFEVPDGLTALRNYQIKDLAAQGGSIVGQEFFRFDDASGFGNCYALNIRISGFETFVNWTKYEPTFARQSNIFISYSEVLPITGGSIFAKSAFPAGTYNGAIAIRSLETTWQKDVFTDKWTGDADVDVWLTDSQESPSFGAGSKFNGAMISGCLLPFREAGTITFVGNGWDVWDFIDRGTYFVAVITDIQLFFRSQFITVTDFISFGAALKFNGNPELSGVSFFGTLGANPFVEFFGSNGGSFEGQFITPVSSAGTCLKLTNATRIRINAGFPTTLVAGQKTIEETGTADFNLGVGCIGLAQGSGTTIIGANSRFVTGTGINIA